jgi:hypothetical protein
VPPWRRRLHEQDEEDGDEVYREHEPVGPERSEDDGELEDRAELDDDVEGDAAN